MTALSDLQFLLGGFAGIDTVHPSPWADGGPAEASARADAELSGALVMQRQVDIRANGERFEVVNLFAADPETDEIVLYSFDSIGYLPDPPARGRRAGVDLVLDRRTERGQARTTYTPTGHGFRWSKEFRPDSDSPWQPVVTGELNRVEDES